MQFTILSTIAPILILQFLFAFTTLGAPLPVPSITLPEDLAIREAHAVSPNLTRFIESPGSGLRASMKRAATSFVSKFPAFDWGVGSAERKRDGQRDDIFLMRSMEDSIVASVTKREPGVALHPHP